MLSVKIHLDRGASAPRYQTEGSAGADICANVPEPIDIAPGAIKAVPTGLYLEIPEGFEVQVRPRSGLALKKGIIVVNSPGTIDSDYRGEVKVILGNLGDEPFHIERGDRIAQLVFARYERAELEESEVLSETGRGDGGFGSTGV